MPNQSAESLVRSIDKPKRASSKNSKGEPKEKCNEFIHGISSSKGRFIVVEGESDKKFYQKWCEINQLEDITIREIGNIEVRSITHDCLPLGSRRTEVLSLALALSQAHKGKFSKPADRLKDRIFCIADRDLGAGVKEFEDLHREFLVYTDFPALESYALTKENIANFFQRCSECSPPGHDVGSELESIFREMFIFWNLRNAPGPPNQSNKYKKLKGRRISDKYKKDVDKWVTIFDKIDPGIDKRSYCYGHDIAAYIYHEYKCVKNSYKEFRMVEEELLDRAVHDESLKNQKLFAYIISKYGTAFTESRSVARINAKSVDLEIDKILSNAE